MPYSDQQIESVVQIFGDQLRAVRDEQTAQRRMIEAQQAKPARDRYSEELSEAHAIAESYGYYGADRDDLERRIADQTLGERYGAFINRDPYRPSRFLPRGVDPELFEKAMQTGDSDIFLRNILK